MKCEGKSNIEKIAGIEVEMILLHAELARTQKIIDTKRLELDMLMSVERESYQKERAKG